MRKSERKRLIATLIDEERPASQADLVAALGREGVAVTQATVSRDLREMGVRKGADRQGRFGYLLPAGAPRNPEEALSRVLAQSGARVTPAQNLVVVRLEPGTAPGAGRAVDELEHREIIGTVAGDDTVLLVLADGAAARRMAKYLRRLAGRS